MGEAACTAAPDLISVCMGEEQWQLQSYTKHIKKIGCYYKAIGPDFDTMNGKPELDMVKIWKAVRSGGVREFV